MSDFPRPVQLVLDDARYWQGLGRQNIDFHQTLGELIDNAISASGEDPEGDLNPFRIEVIIKQDGMNIEVMVADDGCGISLENLENKILGPGGQGDYLGILNEHGFGLKNALCVLTDANRLGFEIQTRDEFAKDNGMIYLIVGPFRRNLNITLDDERNWNRDIEHCKDETGTRVRVKSTFEYLKTLYRRANTLDTLMERLGEHLGVMYRGFLEQSNNKIWLRWMDVGGEWCEERIVPINVPYIKSEKMNIPITIGGITSNVKYEFGEIDDSISKDENKEWPYPLKIYYQHNLPSSGIDIRVRNRVVLTQQLNSLWSDIHRRPDYNWLGGELILDDKFRTVNNKTALDANNPFWQRLREKLSDKDPDTQIPIYKPKPNQKELGEASLREKIAKNIEISNPGSRVTQNHSVWSGAGVRADIYVEDGDDVHVYELKTGTAQPIDVYQLLMYWDGVVKDEGQSPNLGRLVAKDAHDSVGTIIIDINGRKDGIGNNYNLEFKKISDWTLT